MKRPLLLILILSFTGFTVNAQKELFGNWKAYCLLEYTAQASLAFCDICPVKQKDQSLTVSDLGIEINENTIKFKADDTESPEPYSWNDNLHTISFKYNNKGYIFLVLIGSGENSLVLKSKSDGNILYLERIK